MNNKAYIEFPDGPVTMGMIQQIMLDFGLEHSLGAMSTFMGQVRADDKDKGTVQGILYEVYDTMAKEYALQICTEAQIKYQLAGIWLIHSKGFVKTGEISLMVGTASVHRKNAIEACSYLVEKIKSGMPAWGKEILANGNEIWKINTKG